LEGFEVVEGILGVDEIVEFEVEGLPWLWLILLVRVEVGTVERDGDEDGDEDEMG